MSDGWYVKSDRQILGPITTAELRTFSADGVLPPETQVRHGVAGKWTALCDVAPLHEDDSAVDPSAAAAKILDTSRQSIRSGGSAAPKPPGHTSHIVDIAGCLLPMGAMIATAVLYPFFWIVRICEPWKRPLTIGLLSFITIGLPVYPWMALHLTPSCAELYASLEPIWQQIQEAREMPDGASSSTGIQFQLQRIASSVERRRSLTHPGSLHCLIFGHDKETAMALADLHRLASSDLPGAMSSGSKVSIERDLAIERQLESVHGHLTQRISPYLPQPSALALRSRYRAAQPSATQGTQSGTLFSGSNIILAIDVMLVLGAIHFWRRARKAS